MWKDPKKQPDLQQRVQELDDIVTILLRCRDLDVPITPEMTEYVAKLIQEIELERQEQSLDDDHAA